MALPHGAVSWPTMCDYGIFGSYSLTFSRRMDMDEDQADIIRAILAGSGVATTLSLPHPFLFSWHSETVNVSTNCFYDI